MINKGDLFPSFELDSDSAGSISSKGLLGKRYVIYFYPKDDTPGCTVESCGFRDNLPQFNQISVPLFGISTDDINSHAKFAGKQNLNFPLLSDPERKLIDPLGLWVEKTYIGRKYMGTDRVTFIVGPDGRVEHVFEKVKPEGHPEEVLAVLKTLPALKKQ